MKFSEFSGKFLLWFTRLVPARSAAAGFFIGLAAFFTTSTTSCDHQVMCYDPAPPDTIPQDTVDSTRHFVQPDTINDFHEKK